MTVLISGGAKNGKSTLAQRLAKQLAGGERLYYLATMIPHDAEDEARIQRHIAARAGWGFSTVECGTNITKCIIDKNINGSFLLDSVTALLANEMFPPTGQPDFSAPQRVEKQLLDLCAYAHQLVLVSDSIGCDTGGYDPVTEAYRAGLARVERALAARCDAVCEVCAGQVLLYKGALPE